MGWLHVAVLALAATGSDEVVLLDFYADWCGPCRQMSPTLDELSMRGYPVRKVNADHDRALAQRYQVKGLPTFVILVNGCEVDRVEGATSYGRLLQMFKTAKASLAKSDSPEPPVKMPPKMPSLPAPAAAIPAVASAPVFAGDLAVVSALEVDATPQHDGPAPGWKPATVGWSPKPQPLDTKPTTSKSPPQQGALASNAQLIAASVRLRIEDPDGRSCGTGTIIDARQGWALILTCGHIFRDSKGKGRIEVDLFGAGGSRRVEGELVSYDMDCDVGLLKIRVPGPVVAARVAPPGFQIANGDPVVTVGCNNGDDPSVQHTRVRAQDKFLGPPNLEIDGLPVEGRSGGGLFTPDGTVIGVCNAADPTDNQGMYAALASIHNELDEAGLAYVYQSPEGTLLAGQNAPTSASPRAELVTVAPPSMPPRMPAAPMNVQAEGPLRPTAARSTSDNGVRWRGLSVEQRTALEEIERRKAAGAEVICIIRSRTDPTAKSEIVVLDKASPQFLRALAAQTEQRLQQMTPPRPANRPLTTSDARTRPQYR